MPPPSEAATAGTPLAPSVEKAYYRKCIELKRRLNEVEAANDEAKIKRVRLDRAIMKMRLERAFLLEQLSRRMEVNVDGSEGSGDEGLATTQEPPPERPHRDRRRRPERPLAPQQHSSTSHGIMQQQHMQSPSQPMQHPLPPQPQQYPLHSLQRLPTHGPGGPADIRAMVPGGPDGGMVPANAITPDGHLIWLPPQNLAALPPPPGMQPVPSSVGYGGSPYGGPVPIPRHSLGSNGHHGFDGAADERESPRGINRAEHAMGEPLSAGSTRREDGNGERRMTGDGGAGMETDRMEAGRAPGGGGFSAINH